MIINMIMILILIQIPDPEHLLYLSLSNVLSRQRAHSFEEQVSTIHTLSCTFLLPFHGYQLSSAQNRAGKNFNNKLSKHTRTHAFFRTLASSALAVYFRNIARQSA